MQTYTKKGPAPEGARRSLHEPHEVGATHLMPSVTILAPLPIPNPQTALTDKRGSTPSLGKRLLDCSGADLTFVHLLPSLCCGRFAGLNDKHALFPIYVTGGSG